MNVKSFLFPLALILVAALMLPACNAQHNDELTFADFCTEDGVFQFPMSPKGMTEASFQQYMGVSRDVYSAQGNAIIQAIADGISPPNNDIIFTMYGFRWFGGPTATSGDKPINGSMLTVIDDGQTYEQWQELNRSIMDAAHEYLITDSTNYYANTFTSKDGMTEVYIEHKRLEDCGTLEIAEDGRNSYKIKIGEDTRIDFIWLKYSYE